MGKRKYIRTVVAYKDYFKEFKKTVSQKVIDKFYEVFIYIMTLEVVPRSFLRSIEGVKGLFEIRIEESGNIYRVFCCLDEGNLVVLFNAFRKKTQKTPSNEIAKAKRIMDEYFADKNNKHHG
jgi:phage-related protein